MKDPLDETYEEINKRIEQWEKGKKDILDPKNFSEKDLKFFEGAAEVLDTYASNDGLRTIETVEGEHKVIPDSEREKLKGYAKQLKQIVKDIRTRNYLDEIGNNIIKATNTNDEQYLKKELPKKLDKIEDDAGSTYYQLEDARKDIEKGRYQDALLKVANAKKTFEGETLERYDIPMTLLKISTILKFGKESII